MAGEAARDQLIVDEERKLRRLRFLVDLTISLLYQDQSLTPDGARCLVRNTEKAILAMFPDKQFTFDLVLLPRFERVLQERWGVGLNPTVH
jgi:hypothetical protein